MFVSNKGMFMHIFLFIKRNPCSVVANVLDCDIVVSGFELQLHKSGYFGIIPLGKFLSPLYPPTGLNNITAIILKG